MADRFSAESRCDQCEFRISATFTRGDAWLYREYLAAVAAHHSGTLAHGPYSMVRHNVATVETWGA